MPTQYRFSEENNFENGIDISQLDDEINANVVITQTLNNITQTGDIINIEFASDLTGKEKMALYRVIRKHRPGLIRSHIEITPRKEFTKSNKYARMARYLFPGTGVSSIVNIKVTSYMQSGVTDYDVRVYDLTNGNVIVEKTLNNTDETVTDLGTLSNLPSSEASLEFHVKRNGGSGKKIYVENFAIYFG